MSRPIDTDLKRFVELVETAWEEIECCGYSVIDAVSDVLNDHYGYRLVKGSQNRSIAGPGDSREDWIIERDG